MLALDTFYQVWYNEKIGATLCRSIKERVFAINEAELFLKPNSYIEVSYLLDIVNFQLVFVNSQFSCLPHGYLTV